MLPMLPDIAYSNKKIEKKRERVKTPFFLPRPGGATLATFTAVHNAIVLHVAIVAGYKLLILCNVAIVARNMRIVAISYYDGIA